MPFKQLGVELSLQASSFRAGLGMAAAELKAFGTDIQKVGQASNQHLKTVGTDALILGAGFVAGFGIAANAAMGFEKELSNLQGVSSATSAEMDRLRQQALDAGAATVFSAQQAVEAQVELAKAGVSTADILGGALTGALNLAAAGGLSLADSATIAANAMTTFGLSGGDVSHIADVLAAGANKSAADVDGMSQSLQQSSLVASQFGLTLDETVGVLSMFAQNGLKGSDAGTSFKTMLQRLVPQSDEAKKMMQQLGLHLFDAQGNFVGISAAAEQFQNALSGLTQEQRANALQTIFGQDAIRAAAILYQSGAEGVDEWTGKVNDSGYAADLAATKMDNLAGDVENLRGSFETALITGGSQATGVLRGLTQGANDLVQGFIALPPALQGVGVGFAGAGGSALLLLGTVGTLMPKIREARDALEGMGRAGELASAGVGKLATGTAVALPGITVALTLLGNIEQQGRDTVAEITKNFTPPKSYGELANQVNALGTEYERLRDIGSGSDIIAFGQNLNPFQDNTISDARAGARDLESLIDDQQAALGRWRDANTQLQHALGLSSGEVDELAQKARIDLTGAVETTVPAMIAAFTAMTSGTGETRELTGAMGDLGSGVASVEDKLKALDAALKGVIDTAFGMESANDAVWRSLNRLPDAVKEVAEEAKRSGSSFEDAMRGNSDAAIGLRDVMRGLVDNAKDVIEQWAQQGVQGQQLTDNMTFLKQSIIDQAAAYGVPQEEAERYLGVLDLFPVSKETTFSNNANAAQTLAEEYGQSIYLLPNEKYTQIQALVDQGKIAEARAVLDELARPRSVSITAYYSAKTTPSGVPYYLAKDPYGERWGGVVRSYAAGGIEAHIARGTLIKYAEPETGGEAYIPRLGDRNRNLDILRVAAAWNNARVVAFAAGGIAGSGTDAATAIREQHSREDIQFKVGMLSNAEYRALLVERMAATEQFSQDWYAAWQGITQIDQDAYRATVTTQQALLDAQQKAADEQIRREDNMYRAGATTTAAYLETLRARLVGLQEYSDEWMRVSDQISTVEDQVLRDQQQKRSDQLDMLRNEVEFGAATPAQLLRALQDAQSGLVKYSNEWTSLQREIDRVKKDNNITTGPPMDPALQALALSPTGYSMTADYRNRMASIRAGHGDPGVNASRAAVMPVNASAVMASFGLSRLDVTVNVQGAVIDETRKRWFAETMESAFYAAHARADKTRRSKMVSNVGSVAVAG